MNNLFLEIMAARASADGNPAVLQLLEQLRVPGADTERVFQKLLAQLGEKDPAVDQLIKRWAEVARKKTIEVEAVEQVQENPSPTFDESAVSEIKEYAASMFSELQVLRGRVDQLAAALGACCACWGEDVNCRLCRGRGTPGFALPDEGLFEHYVLPAILLVRGLKPARQQRKVEGNQTSPEIRTNSDQRRS